MTMMGNMISVFSLQNETNDEYWKCIHIFLELILQNANKLISYQKKEELAETHTVLLISGALFMISKIWLRCPIILKANPVLLNYYWFFTNNKNLVDSDKVHILQIYLEFLVDFKDCSSKEDLNINFGEFIDTLKQDSLKNLSIFMTSNSNLRRV